jgi:hypothetical protein
MTHHHYHHHPQVRSHNLPSFPPKTSIAPNSSSRVLSYGGNFLLCSFNVPSPETQIFHPEIGYAGNLLCLV